MDPLTLAVLGIAGLVALTRKARPQSPAAATTGPASSDSGPRYVSTGGVAVYPGQPAPQPSAAELAARQAAIDKATADAYAREHAQLNQAAGALNQIVPGGGTVVKFLANAAEALGLSSPIYHFPANFDPYDWIASHHFDVLALEVHGVLAGNDKQGDQGPGMGEPVGPPITPLQGWWFAHSRIGTLSPGDHGVDEIRTLMPPAPPRGFGNPLPVPGAASWQEVVRNIEEWPPPTPVDPRSINGGNGLPFVLETIARGMDNVALADWRDAGGGRQASERHPEQFYAKHPALAPAPAPATMSSVFGAIGQALAAAAAAVAPATPAPAPTPTSPPQLPPPPASTLPPISFQAVLRGTVLP